MDIEALSACIRSSALLIADGLCSVHLFSMVSISFSIRQPSHNIVDMTVVDYIVH